MSKISADMEALGVQSDIGRRYVLALDRMEATLKRELKEALPVYRGNSVHQYHPKVYEAADRRHAKIKEKFTVELDKITRARRLVPMVEAGLMTAAEAMKSVLGDP